MNIHKTYSYEYILHIYASFQLTHANYLNILSILSCDHKNSYKDQIMY
jgi:hypothetical protein